MSKIIIYTADRCGYCAMAKQLLDKKEVSYIEQNINSKPGLQQEMIQKTQRRTVPQIFIGDRHIGGFDELYALEMKNELDTLLMQ